MIILRGLTLTLFALPLFESSAATPHGRLFWIQVKDSFARRDSLVLYFGNWPKASYGIDSLGPECREFEAPPLPPGFDARWVNIPGRSNAWGLGLLWRDFRGLTKPSGRDTFALRCHNGDELATSANFTISWPGAACLKARCDSMFLVDPSHFLLKERINMFQQQSVFIPHPGEGPLETTDFRVFIVVAGARYPDAYPCPPSDGKAGSAACGPEGSR